MWRHLRHGVLPSLEHADIAFGRDFATVFDVGASRGQFAVFAAMRFPDATIVCFEPLPNAFATLKKVTARSRVALHRVALGATQSQTLLNVSAHDDSSSLLPIGAAQVSAFPGTQLARTIPVPVHTLSDYLSAYPQRPNLLKIDVQGYELAVLKGAGDRLAIVDELLVECSFVELYGEQPLVHSVVQYLAEHGFGLVDVRDVVRGSDGIALQADFRFQRR